MPETVDSGKRDLLKTSPAEAREMENLIARGHQAHNVVGALTFVGIAVLIVVGLYYEKLDKLGVGDMPYRYPDYLQQLVQNQVKKDRDTYGARKPSSVPEWPRALYVKLRMDLYIIAGASLLLALIFVHIEKAKLRRSDLLVYRALAREIEKLRTRIKQLEGGKKPPTEVNEPSPGSGNACADATGVKPEDAQAAVGDSSVKPSEKPTETGL